MAHVALFGDSTFDNALYVSGGPTVETQIRERLAGWEVTRCARDGAALADIPGQLEGRGGATHLVIGVGGVDALAHAGMLLEGVGSMAEALGRLAGVADQFEREYPRMLDAAQATGLPVAVTTIYNPRYPDPIMQKLAVTALMVPNDVILREAIRRGLPVIDLRLVLSEAADYADPIEPSSAGGAKIADAVASLVREHDFARARTAIFTA